MSRNLRRLLIALFALGLVTFAVGLVGDLRDWWQTGLPYTSNVLAGLTGACVGIPFAVLVIQRLLREQEQVHRQGTICELIEKNFKYLARTADSLRGEMSLEDVEAIRDFARLAHEKIAQIRATALTIRGSSDVAHLQKAIVEQAQVALDMARDGARKTQLTDRETTPINWSAVSMRWRFIFQELIPQTAFEGFGTLPDPLVAEIHGFASRESAPFKALIDLAYKDREWSLTVVLSTMIQDNLGDRPTSFVLAGTYFEVERQLDDIAHILDGVVESLSEYLKFLHDLNMAQSYR